MLFDYPTSVHIRRHAPAGYRDYRAYKPNRVGSLAEWPSMPDQPTITLRIERELAAIHDPSLLDLVRQLLVEPYAVARDWDYGVPGRMHVCWTVLEHQPSGTGVAYCEEGFGPAFPWGLVSLSGPNMNMGMDSAWFASLEDAVRECPAWDGEPPPDYEVS